jgi:hypothetical protein
MGDGIYVLEFRRAKTFYGVEMTRGEIMEIDSTNPMNYERLRRALSMVGPPSGLVRVVDFRPSTSATLPQDDAEPAIADA